MKKTLYEFLGVESNATPEEIKAAAQQLARKFHPSKYPGNPRVVARFNQIKRVYNTLANPQKRADYDATLEKVISKSNPTPSLISSPTMATTLPAKNSSKPNYFIQSEQIIYRAYIHWFGYIKALFLIGIAAYLLWFSDFLLDKFIETMPFGRNQRLYFQWSLLSLFWLGIFLLLQTLLIQLTTTLVITSQQIIANIGLIFKQNLIIKPDQFEQLEIQQSQLGKIFGFGTLKLRGTKGKGVGEIAIKIYNVAAPHQFEQQLWRFIKTNAQ
ncbi:MAG: DnaJ domain-containing protein [Thioploca sp.]|nr:DnaJ domain-containing protein [Thioploca sp.]